MPRRRRRYQNSGEAIRLAPANLTQGVIDIVEHDLGEAAPPAGCFTAEVDNPAVVRLQARKPSLVLRPRGRDRRDEVHLRVEGRKGIREYELGGDALRLHVPNS